ncbi:aldo/keto reductase [Streptomyces albus]|uniref:aldo/keto reductase n=1 Tax=Streptomyces albus TaxID=1888 RepID=UPI0033E83BF9
MSLPTPLPTLPLGHSGMALSRTGLGTWAMGGQGPRMSWGPQNDEESIRTVLHAVGNGINWLDTAPVYGLGHAEEVVGRALRRLPASERPYVFTKCGLRWDENAQVTRRGTADSLRHEAEQSLRRLGVEQIDLYQMHWPAQDGTAVEEYWETLLELRDAGLVRAVGLSNHGVAELARAAAVETPASVQPALSALVRDAAAEVIPWCRERGVGVVVHSPMHQGLLSGAFDARRLRTLAPDDWRRRSAAFSQASLAAAGAVVSAFASLGRELGVPTAAVAVAWTLSVPGVTGAIVGARTPGQLSEWLPAARLRCLEPAAMAQVASAIREAGAGSGPLVPALEESVGR